jgi:nucleolar complex protein 2
MVKPTKQFKKFASSGKLKDTIQKRRQIQQIRRKAEDRDARRAKQRGAPLVDGDGEDEDEDELEESGRREMKKTPNGVLGGVKKTVDELFGEGGLDGVEDAGSDLEDLEEDDDDGDEEEDEGEGIDEEEGLLDEKAMKKAMKDLAKNDPEFFKYLEENDKELLEFGGKGGKVKEKGKGKEIDAEGDIDMGEADEEDDEDEDEDEDEDGEVKKISVTLKMLRGWQEGMLKVSIDNISKCRLRLTCLLAKLVTIA